MSSVLARKKTLHELKERKRGGDFPGVPSINEPGVKRGGDESAETCTRALSNQKKIIKQSGRRTMSVKKGGKNLPHGLPNGGS